MQNCAIKHGLCFSLSINFSVGLAELAESLRNYLEATIKEGFKRSVFTVYHNLLFLPGAE